MASKIAGEVTHERYEC